MNGKIARIRLVFACLLAVAIGNGCASAASAPATAASDKGDASPAAGESESMGVEGAMAEIDRSEAELQQALGLPAFAEPPKGGAAAPGQAMAQPPAPAPAETAAADAAPRSEPIAAQSSSADACTIACRALAGMARATGHLCDLSGETDARCENARARVRGASERVHSHCPACTGD